MNATRFQHYRWVAWIALAMVGCVSKHSSPEQIFGEPTGRSLLEHRIDARIHDWFAYREDPSDASDDLLRFLGDRRCEFRLPARTIRGRDAILEWATLARRQFVRIEVEVGPIEIRIEDTDRVRAEFAVDRRAWDEAGLMHISRTQHSWQIGVGDGNTPFLVNAREWVALPHPGTGTQVLCL